MEDAKPGKSKQNSRHSIKNETMTIERHDEHPCKVPSKPDVLQDLGNALAVHAERMKLLSRAEEGLVSESFSPYSGTPLKTSPSPSGIKTYNVKDASEKATPSKIPVKKPNKGNKEKKDTSKNVEKTSKQKSTTRNGSKSSISIKNYRADYTWNRGGRLKELRLRSHYERQLKQKAFYEWHDFWWGLRKEWRLMVRAECHYRYVMWNKLFQAWRLYTLYSKAHEEKLAEAENYANRRLLKRSMKNWLTYVMIRRRKGKEKTQIMDSYNHNMLRSAWLRWKEHYQLTQERKDMEVTALQFWAYRIQAQHWLIWMEKLKRKRQLYHRHALALRHYNYTTKQKCFVAWAKYWIMKRSQKQQQEYADMFYQRTIKFRAFQIWIQRYEITQSIKAHQGRIQSLARVFQLRRFFQQWKLFMVIREEEEEKRRIAVAHYRHRCLVLGFSAFHLNVVQSHLKRMRNEMALKHYIKSVERSHWDHWLRRCENNEELRIIRETREAQAHYSMTVKHKCFAAWTEFTRYKQHRQRQCDRADAYYYANSMPKYLFRWKVFVGICKMKQEFLDKQLEFRRENLLARFFYTWYNSYEESRETRLNERMAILHYDDCLRRRFMEIWKRRTEAVLQDQEKEELASAHYRRELCRRHLDTWIEFIHGLKTDRSNEVKAALHHKRKMLRKLFNAWKSHTIWEREEKRSITTASKFYSKKLCQKAIQKLKCNAKQGRTFKQASEEKYRAKCHQLLRWAFVTWQENVTENREERLSEEKADVYYHRNLLHKLVTTWHRYAVIHAYKKSETRQWVTSIREVLDKNKLWRLFNHWRERRDDSVVLKLKYEHAVHHHKRCVLQKCMVLWRDFTQGAIRKSLLCQQGAWFEKTRLTSWSFSLWKQRYEEAQEQNRKTDVALWHWSLVLQKKVLDGWLLYVSDKKRKKQRIADALSRRRNRLIKDGVVKWLRVSSDLASMRAKFAAQQNAVHAFEQHQLIQRCAIHWRLWTSKRKKERADHSQGRQNAVIFPVKETKPSSVYPERWLAAPPALATPIAPPPSLTTPKAPPHVQTKPLVPPLIQANSPVRPVMSEYPTTAQYLPHRVAGRKKPRHPSFLVDSLKKAGLFATSSDKDHNIDDKQTETGSQMELERRKHISVSQHDQPSDMVKNSADEQQAKVSELEEEILIEKQDASVYHVEPPSNVQFSVGMDPQLKVLNWQNQGVNVQMIQQPSLQQHKLLTPADFMLNSRVHQSQDQGPVERLNLQGLDYSPLSTPRTVDSAFLAVQSTLKTIDSTPSDDLRAEESLGEKIVKIRDRLKEFETNKRRLRKLQKQKKLLSEWLRNSGKDSHDMDEVKQEFHQIEVEVNMLQRLVTEQKPECTELVQEVQRLMSILGT
ncbi:hypothetical protein FSP39_021123 [Pinctada imbricata]|uniref:SFI1 n=1 Tax=Pinctada imbricata TaxID=66713 RepID=A0AA88Y1L0_PINIB|nr:hypothetical protein FSP39_021123 [Pinctada imbricata]